MIENKHEKYAAFDSNFMSVTVNKQTGKVAFIGIESGGRQRDRHATYNLLLPGKAAMPGAFNKKTQISFEATEDAFRFTGSDGATANMEFTSDKSFVWAFEKAPRSNIVSIDFSIRRAPITIWCEDVCKEMKHLKSKNPQCVAKHRYSLPFFIHFPDYGFLKVESDKDDVYCEEELLKSVEYEGLGLGYANYGYHNQMNAVHFGSSHLKFKSKTSDSVKLTFTVLDEAYPSLPFEDNGEWDGIKRCWMNSFSLNREMFDMGDNISLHGTAHLAVHMKSDLLQVMGEDNERFKLVRRVFEKQIKNSFLLGMAPDGEVNYTYIHNKEKKRPMCNYIDSIPGVIISTAGISHWNMRFAKKLVPYAIRTADFIMTLDGDGDGIFETPFPGDCMEQEQEVGYRQSNWWDNFAFGHKDIYFNCLCHRALREFSQLLRKLKMDKEAEKYEDQLKKFRASFLDTFYNPDTTLLAGWVSRNGKKHDYMFTFAVSMAVDEGLIDEIEGKRMLLLLLDEMKKEGYGDLRYGIPGNVKPVDPVDTYDWAPMMAWGQYENGGLSGMNGFHFLTAMYKVGLDTEADAILKAIVKTYEDEFTHSGLMPGYVQSCDWRTKEGHPCGYNYLADNYYFLLAAYTGKGKIPHPAVVGDIK